MPCRGGHRPPVAFKHPRRFYYGAPYVYGGPYVSGFYGDTGVYGSVDYPPADAPSYDPPVVYTVPPPSGGPGGNSPRKFTIHVTDFYGSLLFPSGAPRIPSPHTYRLDVSVTTQSTLG